MVAVVPIGIYGLERYNPDDNSLINLLYGFHLVRCGDIVQDEQGWIFDDLAYVSDDGNLYHLLVYVTNSFVVVGVLDDFSRELRRSSVVEKEGDKEADCVIYTVPFVFLKNEYVMRPARKTAAYLGTLGSFHHFNKRIQPVLTPIFASEHDNAQEVTSLLRFVPTLTLCDNKERKRFITKS